MKQITKNTVLKQGDRITTINNILMIVNGEYCFKILKENDNSEVFEIIIGGIGNGNDTITLLYGKETLSIRKFQTTYNGGDVFFLEMSFENVPKIITSLLKGHNLELYPIYHVKTVKYETDKK